MALRYQTLAALSDRVLRFNSGRGLQLSQSTSKKTASATRRRRTLVDLFGQGHRALDAAQLKRRPSILRRRHGNFRRRRALHARGTLDYFCAMQQSIGAMRQLSMIIMVYQRTSPKNVFSLTVAGS